MDEIGLLKNITLSADHIYQGKQWLDTKGKEADGRLSFHKGLSLAMESFEQVKSYMPDNLELVILAEYTFLAQELEICDSSDTMAISSVTSAMQSIDDALLSLKAVADTNLYKGADMTYPHNTKYRYKGMPKDAFHIMCIAHRTRISNTLRVMGINLTEKEFLTQRLANINSAQTAYLVNQQKIMEEINKDQSTAVDK